MENSKTTTDQRYFSSMAGMFALLWIEQTTVIDSMGKTGWLSVAHHDFLDGDTYSYTVSIDGSRHIEHSSENPFALAKEHRVSAYYNAEEILYESVASLAL